MSKIKVSTPSRICLFGEHQDYLGLEVISLAINLRFKAVIENREDQLICLKLKGENIDEEKVIDLSKPIIYDNNRDYLKSSVNVLLKKGYEINHGFNIDMDSEIPIGKGMCSSSTMIIVYIKAILEAIGSSDKDDAELIARLGFEAEVTEFNEPGGMMDHYSSAVGGLNHMRFDPDKTVLSSIDVNIPGYFILFDSLQDKNTTKVLADAKFPVVEALQELEEFGINSVRDFVFDDKNLELLSKLDERKRRKLEASIDNYRILLKGKEMLESGKFDDEEFGDLIKRHHVNLRDGLEISTVKIEEILNTAYANGALGGKVNGSGGGGCCYVYAKKNDVERIVNAVTDLGYTAIVLKQDGGVRRDG